MKLQITINQITKMIENTDRYHLADIAILSGAFRELNGAFAGRIVSDETKWIKRRRLTVLIVATFGEDSNRSGPSC